MTTGTSTPECTADSALTPQRWGPLFGLATAVLAVASIVINTQLPHDQASAAKVVSYLAGHKSAITAASFIGALSAVTLVLFAAHLREVLAQDRKRADALPNAAFAGAVILAAGLAFTALVNLSAARAAGHGFSASAQTLNVLSNNGYILNTTGMATLLLASGVAALRGHALPGWLGWSGIAIGLVALAGPIGPIAAPLTILWIVVASIRMLLLARRDAAHRPPTRDSGSRSAFSETRPAQ
jgi:hypothetical protein